jgi:hypothetical protein
MLSVFFLTITGMPFSWKKFGGGYQFEWIGYWLDYGNFTLGISAKRSEWLVKTFRALEEDPLILVRRFNEVWGRVAFVTEVLEFFRPFLGPGYAWIAAVPVGSCLSVPRAIRLIARLLRTRLETRGSTVRARCEAARGQPDTFRADAKAEGGKVVIGGWECSGGKSSLEARWYSVTLTPQNAAWAFAKEQPFRLIASLELLATLVSVMVLVPNGDPSAPEILIPGSTDNQGNSFVGNRLMTTKFPLCVILMELVAQLDVKCALLDLRWVRRDENALADALTNDDFTNFTLSKRVPVDLATMTWILLQDFMAAGAALYGQLDFEKAKRAASATAEPVGKGAVKTPRSKRLRFTDPW